MTNTNTFEHAGQIVVGCTGGQHLWDEEEGHSTVEKDSDLTKIKLKCLRCEKQFDITAPFGFNRFIRDSQPERKPIVEKTITNDDQQQPLEETEMSPMLKRLLR